MITTVKKLPVSTDVILKFKSLILKYWILIKMIEDKMILCIQN